MNATLLPDNLMCESCHQRMLLRLTDLVAVCTTQDCQENGKEYELPQSTVPLTPKSAGPT